MNDTLKNIITVVILVFALKIVLSLSIVVLNLAFSLLILYFIYKLIKGALYIK